MDRTITIASQRFDVRLTTSAVRKADAAMTRKTIEIINDFARGRLLGADETVELLFRSVEGQHGIRAIEQLDALLDEEKPGFLLETAGPLVVDLCMDFYGFKEPDGADGSVPGAEGNPAGRAMASGASNGSVTIGA